MRCDRMGWRMVLPLAGMGPEGVHHALFRQSLLEPSRPRRRPVVVLPFEIQQKEPLRLILVLGRSPHSGIYQPILDGVKLRGPIDLYRGERDVDDYQIMDFWPEPGKYTLRLECVGRNHLSDGYGIDVNSVRLRQCRPRVREIGYLKDHDWRAEQILIDRTAVSVN